MVVKTRVPFWLILIIRHLLFRVPERDLNFDNPFSNRAPLEFGLRPVDFAAAKELRGPKSHVNSKLPKTCPPKLNIRKAKATCWIS